MLLYIFFKSNGYYIQKNTDFTSNNFIQIKNAGIFEFNHSKMFLF